MVSGGGMSETLRALIDELWNNFRIVDAVDIALMSLILYWVLRWFRETASRRVIVGVSVLLVVYFAARAFGMQLTSLVFHAWFAFFVIMVVVVFQEDLRRMFERVAEWGILRRRSSKQSDLPIDTDEFVKAIYSLAEAKTGALVVIKGNDPLRRHLSGGVTLNGRFSRSLLLSIFDSSSPGHDGAVVIRSSRVSNFGVHLPITKNQREVAGRGTRHSAALGLSERCDALVIVVSEERGVVSVAESGRLEEMSSRTALAKRLRTFYATKFPTETRGSWKRFVTEHGLLKVFAVLVTIFAWFVLAYDAGVLRRTLVIPIEYRNVPDALQLGSTAPSEARVTVSGPKSGFRFLDPASLTVSLDLSEMKMPGVEWLTISESDLNLPGNLEMEEVEPGSLRLDLRAKTPTPTIVQRTFEVAIEYRNLPEGLQLGTAAPSEARVTLSGPEGRVREVEPKAMVISIDLGEIEGSGVHWIPIGSKALSLPAELTMDEVVPRTLRLDLRVPSPSPSPAAEENAG